MLISAPFVGLFSDRYGGNGISVLCAAVGIIAVFSLMLLKVLPPVLCIISLGLLFSINGVIVSLLPRFVDDAHLGTAFGIAYSMSNLGVMSMNVIVGVAKDYLGWKYVLAAFVTSISLAFIVACVLNITCKNLNWSRNRLWKESRLCGARQKNGDGKTLRQEETVPFSNQVVPAAK